MLLKAISARLGPPPAGLLPGFDAFEMPPQVLANHSLKRILEKPQRCKNILDLCLLCLHWNPQDRASALQLLSACQWKSDTRTITTAAQDMSIKGGSGNSKSQTVIPSKHTSGLEATSKLTIQLTAANATHESFQDENKKSNPSTPSIFVKAEPTDHATQDSKTFSVSAKRPRWNSSKINQVNHTEKVCRSAPTQTAPTPPGASITSAVQSSECTCKSSNCRLGSHGRGQKCLAEALPGFTLCDICKCQDPTCNKSQLGISKFCYTHVESSLSPPLRLVQLMGVRGLLPDMEPSDLMRLRELKTALLLAHGAAMDWSVLFIAAWAKDWDFLGALLEIFKNVSPKARLETMYRKLQEALKQISNRHNLEAFRCTGGGRGQGLKMCLKLLRVALPKSSKSAAWQPLPKAEVVSGIGSKAEDWSLGNDTSILRHVLTAFRGHGVAPCADIPSANTWFKERLTELAELAPCLGLAGDYVEPAIRLKFLLLLDIPSKALHLKELSALNLADKMEYVTLQAVPHQFHGAGILAKRFRCPQLCLHSYACLAGGALRKHPDALSYLKDAEHVQSLTCTLKAFWEKEGFAPSFSRLFLHHKNRLNLMTATAAASEHSDSD